MDYPPDNVPRQDSPTVFYFNLLKYSKVGLFRTLVAHMTMGLNSFTSSLRRNEQKIRKVGKEGLSREKPVDTNHDLGRVRAQPMPTMMDLGQCRSLKQHTLTVTKPSGIGASPMVLTVIRLPVVTNLKLFGTHF